jgi:predicted DsbA family dithiol-disulfide isomerase
MTIEVYADVVCPWCYIGAKRLERALALRPEAGVDLRWRPFQLQPHMPAGGLPWREFAKAKFGGEEGARGAFARVTSVGASEGITFDFDRVASAPNTVDAHRVILHAARYALQRETANALFAAYFSEGRDLNDYEQLADIASGAGLDADEVRSMLASGEGAEEVRSSQEEAGRLGISGVPFYVFDGRYAVSGAQPVEVFLRALDAAYNERAS